MLLELALLAVVKTAPVDGAPAVEPVSTPPVIEAWSAGAAPTPEIPAELSPAPTAVGPEAPLSAPTDPGAMGPPALTEVPVPPQTPEAAALPPSGERVINANLVVEDAPAAAPGDAPKAAQGVSASAAKKDSPKSERTHFGMVLDVGVPDGAGLQLVYRPWWFLRTNAGYTQNGLGHGIKGGVTLVPYEFPIIPTLSLEMGHAFSGDGKVLESFGVTLPDELKDGFSYTYYSGHLGLEVGSHRRFLFFLRGGVSKVNATAHGLEAILQEASGSATLESDPAKVRLVIPTAKLGFIVFFI